MSRYAPASIQYSFGPGAMTPAVKWIIIANVATFLVMFVFPGLAEYLGLSPAAVIERQWLWQLGTYMFLHVDMFHILFNMLGIWMFGVELEQRWGTQLFLRYYAITGVGAAITTVAASFLPFSFTAPIYGSLTMGASGALYGLLFAYAKHFPYRTILMFFLFPIPVKYFVMIIGAISFLSSIGGRSDGIAHAAHLGGLLFGFLYHYRGRGGMTAEIKYRYLKWKMNRMRRKFDVYSGGRSDWDRNIH
jgi:membrane associated rhomboid family serine protease